MKQKFFSLLAFVAFFAITAKAQHGESGISIGGGEDGYNGMAVGSYKFVNMAKYPKATLFIKRLTGADDQLTIGEASLGCEGMIFLPEGAERLDKANSLIFRCEDGTELSIELTDKSDIKKIKIQIEDETGFLIKS